MKSSNWNLFLTPSLVYRKFFCIIMRWSRTKKWQKEWNVPFKNEHLNLKAEVLPHWELNQVHVNYNKHFFMRKFWQGLKASSEMGIVRFSAKSWVNVATLKLGKNTASDKSEKIWRVPIIFEIKLRMDFLDQ